MGSLLEATDVSIAAAVRDLTLDPIISAGPIAALRELATRVDAASDPDLDSVDRTTLWVKDNVSLPTYLKACAELKLTPASRLDVKKEPAGGNLAKLRSIKTPKSA